MFCLFAFIPDTGKFTLSKNFKKIQLSLDYKKKRSQFIIKNDFTKRTIVKNVKNILKQI